MRNTISPAIEIIKDSFGMYKRYFWRLIILSCLTLIIIALEYGVSRGGFWLSGLISFDSFAFIQYLMIILKVGISVLGIWILIGQFRVVSEAYIGGETRLITCFKVPKSHIFLYFVYQWGFNILSLIAVAAVNLIVWFPSLVDLEMPEVYVLLMGYGSSAWATIIWLIFTAFVFLYLAPLAVVGPGHNFKFKELRKNKTLASWFAVLLLMTLLFLVPWGLNIILSKILQYSKYLWMKDIAVNILKIILLPLKLNLGAISYHKLKAGQPGTELQQ